MGNNINVVTAGPSAGKSSTIRELSARGYRTLPEAARILFDQVISEGGNPEEVRQNDDFHERVESIDRRIEKHIPNDEIVFLDRSLADNLAYRNHFNSPWNYEVENMCKGRYDNIFILDRIEFKDDEVRSEDEEEAEAVHNTIIQTYEELGYNPIEIPVVPLFERVDIIEEHIN